MSSVLKSALLKSSAEAPNEWDLVELQGTLECSRGDPHAFRGVDLGEFHLDDKGTPILVIGNNRLEGKVKALEKQIAVLAKAEEPSSRLTQGSDVHFRVKGVIKRKIIFKTRPKPIRKGKEGPRTKRARRG